MTDADVSTDSFPRLLARTGNFSRGVPGSFTVSPDGARVVFLRAPSGTSRAQALWVHDVDRGIERLVADPQALLAGGETLTVEERARRERLRVTTSGVVAYSTDEAVTLAAFALSSQLFVVDLRPETQDGAPRHVPTTAPVVDPVLDPTGRRVAYAGDRALHVVELGTGTDEVVVGPAADEPDEVVWGLAEFVAAEEFARGRGFWWSPDGERLLVQRYDESPVSTWYISDPVFPERAPRAVRYPRAGTPNAVVSLAVVVPGQDPLPVDWRSDRALDGRLLEYLVHVEWSTADPVLTLLTRDQRQLEYRSVDVTDGRTSLLRTVTDETWVELLPGTPLRLPDGRMVYSVDDGDTRPLWLDGAAFSPPDLLVRAVTAVDGEAVLAQVVGELGSVVLARLGFDGGVQFLSEPDGVAAGASGGGTLVVTQQRADTLDTSTTVFRDGAARGTIASLAQRSPLVLRPRTLAVGPRGLATTVLFPSGHVPGSRRLPVLMDPYGGPHGQRVLNAGRAYAQSQWFAEQGFVVVITDGRGTPGRGPAWERLAWHDRIGTADDQAEAAQEVAALYPDDVDRDRVAVRGWSFGGYLAALCVLRHPDTFAAAIAGAPTTDERWYDTAYSERYLGDPAANADVYEANSLLPLAPQLRRPLLVVHGLADDNVFVAHALRLSSALLAAGRPHEFLPLSGMTHLADDEVVAENLLLLQLDFLRRALRPPQNAL